MKVAILFSVLLLASCVAIDSENSTSSTEVSNLNPVSFDAETTKVVAQTQLQKVLGPEAFVSEVVSLGEGQIYEVMMTDGGSLHMTPDLNFFIYKDTLYQITPQGLVNVSDSRLNQRRKEEMAAIPDSDTVLFKAKGEQKALINIFTDIDCGYCQKLHREIPEMNDLGISVRYLAYPRSGVKDRNSGELTTSYKKINHVWCQGDRAAAMTSMKALQGEINQSYSAARSGSDASRNAAMKQYGKLQAEMGKLLTDSSCESPVETQYLLGRSIGVSGTPAMVTQDGALFPGYVPARELAKRLNIL